jgi:hypothetical protein
MGPRILLAAGQDGEMGIANQGCAVSLPSSSAISNSHLRAERNADIPVSGFFLEKFPRRTGMSALQGFSFAESEFE